MTSKAVVFLAALTLTMSAQTPTADERFYQAIRSDDLTTLRALVPSEGRRCG